MVEGQDEEQENAANDKEMEQLASRKAQLAKLKEQ